MDILRSMDPLPLLIFSLCFGYARVGECEYRIQAHEPDNTYEVIMEVGHKPVEWEVEIKVFEAKF